MIYLYSLLKIHFLFFYEFINYIPLLLPIKYLKEIKISYYIYDTYFASEYLQASAATVHSLMYCSILSEKFLATLTRIWRFYMLQDSLYHFY